MAITRSVTTSRLLAAAVVWTLAGAAWASDVVATRFEAARVVAFGDVHGAYGALTNLLIRAGIVDADLAWAGGDAHVVSLGDLLDRGPDSRKVMDLLRRLQDEAAAAGGRVHVVLGNHELMNLTGDLRYVSDAEFAAFGADGSDAKSALIAAFAPDGTYGRWLLAQPAVVVINRTAFVHGGLSRLAATVSPEQLNAQISQRLAELLALRHQLERAHVLQPHEEVTEAAANLQQRLQDPASSEALEPHRVAVERFVELAQNALLGDQGPLWYRGNATCHGLLEQAVLADALAAWQVQRVVMGHTPTPDHRIRARLDGKAILADTGMLHEHYGGQAAALVLSGDGLSVLYPDHTSLGVPPDIDPGTLLYPASEPALLAALESNDLTESSNDADGIAEASGVRVELQPPAPGARIEARFRVLDRRGISAELAALRLDRMLGLNLVAPVARRTVGGRDGVVAALWQGSITETERADARVALPNDCAPGRSVFDLLYAFDALIQNDGRRPGNMHYDRRTWRLASSGHDDSFGRGQRLPAYLAAAPRVLPKALADVLRTLDSDSLQTALGNTISRAQIRAMLARRDLMLDTWTIGD